MKILFIINELLPGGATRILCDIVSTLTQRDDVGVSVLFFRNSEGSVFLEQLNANPKVSLIDLSTKSPFNPALIYEIRRAIKRHDVVHANLFPSGYLTALAAIGTGKPLFYTEHSTFNRRRDKGWMRPLEQAVYNRFTSVIAISDATGAALSRWLRRHRLIEKIKVIPNGILLSQFQVPRHSYSPKDLYGREGKPLLMVSRFTASKDHASVVKALNFITDKEIFVAFAGSGDNMQAIKDLAKKEGVEERCVFLGDRNDIPQLISSAFIGVQASLWEGFGLTAVEMMAGGLPIVVSDVQGLADIVDGAALLFPKKNYKALAAAVNKLSADNYLYSSQIIKGRERAYEFSVTTTAKKYFGLYQNSLRQ